MDLFQQPTFTYLKSKYHLPIGDKKHDLEGNAIYLMIKDRTQSIGLISNPKFLTSVKYARYFKPKMLRMKILNKQHILRMSPSDIKDYKAFVKSIDCTFIENPAMIKKKNVIVDLSDFFNIIFTNCQTKTYATIVDMFHKTFMAYIEGYCAFKEHPYKTIMINASDWGFSKNAILQYSVSNIDKNLNPISILYYIMKNDVEKFKEYKDFNIVILDGDNGMMWIRPEEVDDKSFNKFHSVLNKFVSDNVVVNDIDAKEPEYEDEELPNDYEIYDKESRKTNISIDNESKIDEEERLARAVQDIEDQSVQAERSASSLRRDKELREKQKKIRIGNVTLGDIDEGKNISREIEEIDISDKIFSPNKNIKKVRFDNFNRSYVKNVMDADIANVFNGLKNREHPVYVRSITKEDTSTEMDLKETWHILLEGEDRVRHSITVDIPKVYDGNYFYLGGNRKQLNNQMFLKPVVKIAPDTVQVCTNYKKIFVYRYGDNLSPKATIFKKIILNNPKLFRVVRGNGTALNNGHKTSIEYDTLAKDFIELQIRGSSKIFKFDQKFFDDLAADGKIPKTDKDRSYIIYDPMAKKKDLMAIPVNPDRDIDNSGAAFYHSVIDLFNLEYTRITSGKSLWELAGPKDKPGKRFMYTRCKVMGVFIPTALFLSYCEGITTFMKKADINYEFTDKRTHIDESKGRIEFADGFLVYDRDPIERSLLMNGFSLVATKNYNFADFDRKPTYLDIFETMYNSRILASGLDSFYNNMIDEITRSYLLKNNYPTDFVSLMIFASNLLADNAYVSELSMECYRIRNMEMVSSFLYKIIADAYSTYQRTANNKTPVKMSIPKNQLLKDMMTSNILEDYSIINPITEKEKLRAVTARGPSGINLERAFTEEKRCYDKTMVGLIGMSTSPDANVGIQREMTIEPKILDTMGNIDMQKPDSEMLSNNVFTYGEQLTVNTARRDDKIRTSMAVKQSKHLIPVKDMSPTLISTGVEKMLPYTASKDFVIRAKDDGIVKEIDNESHMMVLQYKDGTAEVVNLNPIVVKNSGGGFYLSNKLKSDYKLNQKFKKNDVIAAEEKFFSKHYDGTKFCIGTLCKVALMSSFATFEDSKMVTQNLAERMATEMIMKKQVILGKNATVASIVKQGQQVHVGDDLIVFEQSNDEKAMNDLLRNIGDDMKEEIKNLGKTALHSKYDGVIEEIRIYSTWGLDELSPSLRKIVGSYWSTIRRKKNLVRKYKINDATYSGSTFYESDGPIKPDENDKIKGYKVESGGVIIEFYIKYDDVVGVGDKICDFAALKGVVCTVVPKGEEPYTVGRPDEEISTIFPASSVYARMCPSVLPVAFANKVLIELKRKLKDVYLRNSR